MDHLVAFRLVWLLLLPAFFVLSRIVKVSVRPPFLFLSCLDLILRLMTHREGIQLQRFLVSVPCKLLRLLKLISAAKAVRLDHTR